MMVRALYTLVGYLATPLLLAYLWWRGRRQPAYRAHWGERFGYYRNPPPTAVIWLHAVSVGETRAAAPLVAALAARYPDHTLLLTQMTPTGRETAQQLLGDRVQVAYLPYDQPGAVSRFLRYFRPRFGLLMETELWPNLIQGAATHHIPLYLVNARLSERSLRGYLRVRALVGPAVRMLAGIAAQTADDAERLNRLGMPLAQPVAVCGNLKYDFAPDPALLARGRHWRQQLGPAPVLVLANTREGEEALLLAALGRVHWPTAWPIVIVPRHPQRFDEVARLIATHGHTPSRRSTWQAGPPVHRPGTVMLGDSLGEMLVWYAMADVVVMGGSLLDFGSHNLIEPCAAGVPVVLGPSTYNFAEAARLACAAGAAVQVEDADAALHAARHWVEHPEERLAAGQAGAAWVAANQGAVRRVMDLLPD
jgi:3-deoxy-D-manno-octulosonic-acid transferase